MLSKKSFIFIIFFLFSSLNARELLLDSANSFVNTMNAYSNPPVVKELIKRSSAIIIFPEVKRVGLFAGGVFGDGIMMSKDEIGGYNIENISIAGGTFGLQLGFDKGSLIIFALNPEIINQIRQAKLTFGGQASFVVGQFDASASNIDFFEKDLYTFSVKNGAFAGFSLGGTSISRSDFNYINKNSYPYKTLIEYITNY